MVCDKRTSAFMSPFIVFPKSYCCHPRPTRLKSGGLRSISTILWHKAGQCKFCPNLHTRTHNLSNTSHAIQQNTTKSNRAKAVQKMLVDEIDNWWKNWSICWHILKVICWWKFLAWNPMLIKYLTLCNNLEKFFFFENYPLCIITWLFPPTMKRVNPSTIPQGMANNNKIYRYRLHQGFGRAQLDYGRLVLGLSQI